MAGLHFDDALNQLRPFEHADEHELERILGDGEDAVSRPAQDEVRPAHFLDHVADQLQLRLVEVERDVLDLIHGQVGMGE
ncbi:MAG TPA: hypothetical protein DCM67_09560 [Propionibacteriaceae bacterium]|nr:hypothetical protein [Propionibacteriaceae bacterium]